MRTIMIKEEKDYQYPTKEEIKKQLSTSIKYYISKQ